MRLRSEKVVSDLTQKFESMSLSEENTPAKTAGNPTPNVQAAYGSSSSQGFLRTPTFSEQMRLLITESMVEFMPLFMKHLMDVQRPAMADQLDRAYSFIQGNRTADGPASTSGQLYTGPASGQRQSDGG